MDFVVDIINGKIISIPLISKEQGDLEAQRQIFFSNRYTCMCTHITKKNDN